MKIHHYVTIAALLFQLTACTGRQEGLGEKVPDVKADFEKICSACHSADIPLARTKTLEGWRQTVNRMKAKGMEIPDAKASEIAEYLFSIRGVK